ncbi:unnamed protein product [Amoebophrya sp. A25]|nr:unnamed protein product [Amoebophrya sp. A25]|eukprot:GSA25T00019502001.1
MLASVGDGEGLNKYAVHPLPLQHLQEETSVSSDEFSSLEEASCFIGRTGSPSPAEALHQATCSTASNSSSSTALSSIASTTSPVEATPSAFMSRTRSRDTPMLFDRDVKTRADEMSQSGPNATRMKKAPPQLDEPAQIDEARRNLKHALRTIDPTLCSSDSSAPASSLGHTPMGCLSTTVCGNPGTTTSTPSGIVGRGTPDGIAVLGRRDGRARSPIFSPTARMVEDGRAGASSTSQLIPGEKVPMLRLNFQWSSGLVTEIEEATPMVVLVGGSSSSCSSSAASSSFFGLSTSTTSGGGADSMGGLVYSGTVGGAGGAAVVQPVQETSFPSSAASSANQQLNVAPTTSNMLLLREGMHPPTSSSFDMEDKHQPSSSLSSSKVNVLAAQISQDISDGGFVSQPSSSSCGGHLSLCVSDEEGAQLWNTSDSHCSGDEIGRGADHATGHSAPSKDPPPFATPEQQGSRGLFQFGPGLGGEVARQYSKALFPDVLVLPPVQVVTQPRLEGHDHEAESTSLTDQARSFLQGGAISSTSGVVVASSGSSGAPSNLFGGASSSLFAENGSGTSGLFGGSGIELAATDTSSNSIGSLYGGFGAGIGIMGRGGTSIPSTTFLRAGAEGQRSAAVGGSSSAVSKMKSKEDLSKSPPTPTSAGPPRYNLQKPTAPGTSSPRPSSSIQVSAASSTGAGQAVQHQVTKSNSYHNMTPMATGNFLFDLMLTRGAAQQQHLPSTSVNQSRQTSRQAPPIASPVPQRAFAVGAEGPVAGGALSRRPGEDARTMIGSGASNGQTAATAIGTGAGCNIFGCTPPGGPGATTSSYSSPPPKNNSYFAHKNNANDSDTASMLPNSCFLPPSGGTGSSGGSRGALSRSCSPPLPPGGFAANGLYDGTDCIELGASGTGSSSFGSDDEDDDLDMMFRARSPRMLKMTYSTPLATTGCSSSASASALAPGGQTPLSRKSRTNMNPRLAAANRPLQLTGSFCADFLEKLRDGDDDIRIGHLAPRRGLGSAGSAKNFLNQYRHHLYRRYLDDEEEDDEEDAEDEDLYSGSRRKRSPRRRLGGDGNQHIDMNKNNLEPPGLPPQHTSSLPVTLTTGHLLPAPSNKLLDPNTSDAQLRQLHPSASVDNSSASLGRSYYDRQGRTQAGGGVKKRRRGGGGNSTISKANEELHALFAFQG